MAMNLLGIGPRKNSPGVEPPQAGRHAGGFWAAPGAVGGGNATQVQRHPRPDTSRGAGRTHMTKGGLLGLAAVHQRYGDTSAQENLQTKKKTSAGSVPVSSRCCDGSR